MIRLTPGMTHAEIIAAAATVKPSPDQISWQQRDRVAFHHFGMNTYTDREWGTGCEPPHLFSPPAQLDIDQWMGTMRTAGMELVMLTVKHHDGFVLYPTRYTEHSVVHSPYWQQHPRATADVLRSYVDSARQHGLGVGVYLSPADGAELADSLWHDEIRRARTQQDAGAELPIEAAAALQDWAVGLAPQGQARYGNGSKPTARTIPSLVDGDDRVAAVTGGTLPTFEFDLDDYNAYYFNQVYELLTEYGPIDEFWLDGANPWADLGCDQDYSWSELFTLIETLSPRTRIFNGPGGFRWVGNEDGIAPETSWSVVPMTAEPASGYAGQLLVGTSSNPSLGQPDTLSDPSAACLQWLPAECDVSLRPGWFWHAHESPKSPEELVRIYRSSVGRNATLLLNVPPGADGRIAAADACALADFARLVERTEAENLAVAATALLDAEDPRRLLTDGQLTTSWSPAQGATDASLELDFADPVRFDQIQLGEDITHGQVVESASVEVASVDGWRPIAEVTTIGLRRIIQLDEPVTTQRIRLCVVQSRAAARISRLALHLSAPVLTAP